MNEVFFDSVDFYDSSTASQRWTTWGSSITAGAGREGQPAGRSGNTTKQWGQTLTAAVGIATKTDGFASGGCRILDVTGVSWADWDITGMGIPQINIRGTFFFGDGTFSFETGNYSYVVFKVSNSLDMATHHVTVSADLYVDGTLRLSASQDVGVVLDNDANCYGFLVRAEYWCDVYYSTNPSVLGTNWWYDLVVLSNPPTGDGTYTAWSASGGGSHYQDIDEEPPDGDTTYLHTANVGDKDSHTYSFTPPAGTIVGLQLVSDMRYDAAGTASVRQFFRASATDYNGSNSVLSGNYRMYDTSWLTNPDTGVGWVSADIAASEWGEERTA